MKGSGLLLALTLGLPAFATAAPGVICVGASPRVYDVRAFGAIGDGRTVNTSGLQTAIDTASGAGGGVVLVAGGRYATGTLHLKSNVTLRVKNGASLPVSPTPARPWSSTMSAT